MIITEGETALSMILVSSCLCGIYGLTNRGRKKMIHIEIFSYVLNLMIGAGLIVYTYQMVKTYSTSFLRPLLYFIVFSNLLFLIGLITEYCCAYMFGNCLLFQTSALMDRISPFGSLFLIGRTASFIWLILAFQGKPVFSKARLVLIPGTILTLFFFGFRIIGSPNEAMQHSLVVGNRYIYMATVGLFHLALVLLVILGIITKDRSKQTLMLSFGLFYLLGHGVLITARWFPMTPQVIIVLITLIIFNLFPFFWLKRFFLRYHENTISGIEDRADIENLYNQYRVSKREREIAGLILHGKSNKEIESKLFISIHTVKNHIYSLYQKLGVKSRGQLIHFLMESQKRN